MRFRRPNGTGQGVLPCDSYYPSFISHHPFSVSLFELYVCKLKIDSFRYLNCSEFLEEVIVVIEIKFCFLL
ncbi:hypothetical protein L6452_24934 [Arctium lappa]|uniref:Uncharacterized protein n=1 Tax=Arctium lappa TaxID=4217 RepID=A0ACB9AAK8_ARCLA|nr:hypothetical protein L6452_24934 [Arctium lappa]